MTKPLLDNILGLGDEPHYDWASYSVADPTLDLTVPWDLCRAQVKEEFAKFLVGADGRKEQVYLDHNATACLQRVLTCIRSHVSRRDCVLLTTDAEFPGVMAMLDEQWHGPMFVVDIAEAIACGDGSAEEVLKESVDLVWPDVIWISHVTREAGYRFTDEAFAVLRNACPEAIIVLDAAQSCGNVTITKSLLDCVDVFVTSAHKWLMGKPTLGLTYSKPQYSPILDDPAQSYARCYGDGGTGDKVSLLTCQYYLRSMNAAHINANLDTHAQALTDVFMKREWDEHMTPIVWGSLDSEHRSGIITLRYRSDRDCTARPPGTPIHVEPYRRSGEGLERPHPYRFRIAKAKDTLSIVDFDATKDVAGKACREGYAATRLSLHMTHGESDVHDLYSRLSARRSI